MKEIKKVLQLLESAVDTPAALSVEDIAKKHLINEKRLAEIQIEIDKLFAKQAKIEDENELLKDDILEIIGDTKSQSLKFGKILVDFKVKKETGTTKSSPQYKNIVLKLQEQYKIEQRVIDKLYKTYNNGNKTFTTTKKELTITKESKQFIKENFSKFLKSIWFNFKTIFKSMYKTFAYNNKELERLVSNL